MTDNVDFEEPINDQNYKAPPQKSLTEILETDKDDESLRRYKETLLGTVSASPIIVEPANPNRVMVKSLSLVLDDRPEMVLDLSGDLTDLKKKVFKIKEGVLYAIRINFFVQREIVTGLKYEQRIYKLGLQVDKLSHMVGSYAPKNEIQSFTTAQEEMPHGMLSRGTYTVKSLFTDDDGHEHLKWEWCFELTKDW